METETPFVLDPVMLIPTDELIDELLNRFPCVVIGYIEEDETVHINWDGGYCAAIGLAKLLTDSLTTDSEVY